MRLNTAVPKQFLCLLKDTLEPLIIQAYKRCTGGKIKRINVHMLLEEKPATVYPSLYSIMILPQVHLRKPCYDFYFL